MLKLSEAIFKTIIQDYGDILSIIENNNNTYNNLLNTIKGINDDIYQYVLDQGISPEKDINNKARNIEAVRRGMNDLDIS